MSIVEWDASYSVGDDEIDAQHRRLLDVINQLGQLLRGAPKADAASFQKIFDQLALYVTSHFAYEERRIADAGVPLDKVAAHQREHRKILDRLQDFEVRLEYGDPAVMDDLLPFLYGDWLIRHICECDAEFAPFLAAAKSPASGR